jgi:predicted DNA-binding transcriptional regulator AlpA
MRSNPSAIVAPLTAPDGEISRPAERLVFFEDLKSMYGIPYGRVHVYRLMRAGRFPLSVKVIEGGRSAWLDSEIIAWIKSRPRAITVRQHASPIRSVRGSREQ